MGSGVSSVVFVAMFAAFGTANASVPVLVCGYDNNTPQTLGVWTDIRRGPDINMTDGPCTLNFTGSIGSAGDMWITMSGAPGAALPTHQCWGISANVLIKRFDNRKAIGFVTNYDEAAKTGIFFGLYDAGNTDAISIHTFDGATGQLKTQLATKSLGSFVKENTWYLLELDTCENGVDQGEYTMEFSVKDPADPNDQGDCEASLDIPPKPAKCARFVGPLPAGITASGAAGIAGQAKNAFVDSQVRDISFTFTDDGSEAN